MLILISYTHAEIKYIFLFKHKKSCAHFYCIIICTPLVSIRCSVNLSSKPSICICIWMSFEHIICSLRIVFSYLLTSILWCKIYSHNVSSWNKWFRRVTFFFFFFSICAKQIKLQWWMLSREPATSPQSPLSPLFMPTHQLINTFTGMCARKS